MRKYLGNKIAIVGITLILVSVIPFALNNPLYFYPFGTFVLGVGDSHSWCFFGICKE